MASENSSFQEPDSVAAGNGIHVAWTTALMCFAPSRNLWTNCCVLHQTVFFPLGNSMGSRFFSFSSWWMNELKQVNCSSVNLHIQCSVTDNSVNCISSGCHENKIKLAAENTALSQKLQYLILKLHMALCADQQIPGIALANMQSSLQ